MLLTNGFIFLGWKIVSLNLCPSGTESTVWKLPGVRGTMEEKLVSPASPIKKKIDLFLSSFSYSIISVFTNFT